MTPCVPLDEEIELLPTAEEQVSAANPVERQTGATGLSAETKQHLFSGTAALATGVMLERGAGFLANILAARLGGAPVFGAYSLAISTANNISTYAAGGIGATAVRFSGKYSFGSGYSSTLARVLVVVSLVSALVAAAALCFGATPIAHLLHKDSLAPLLRWAAISVVGIIVLECGRGFFVGQRRIQALLLLSMLVGAGMLVFLPWMASTHRPSRMIAAQGCVTFFAVLLCILFSRKLHLRDAEPERGEFRPMLKEVWSFGFVQLSGLVGSNLAGLWLTTLIARSDATLVQMSFFAIASQLRNLAGIAPSLMTEGSYAVMASPKEDSRTPHRVMALCSFGSLSVALLLGCLGITLAPWLMHMLYGTAYSGAALTVAFGLAVAVVHMGNAPAAARLTIVSVRATGVINTVWAVFVAGAATLVLFHGGTAWQGMAILLAAHVLSSVLVLATLQRLDHVPPGMALFYGTGVTLSIGLAFLALLRSSHATASLPLTAGMLVVTVCAAVLMMVFGRRYAWLTGGGALRTAMAGVLSRIGVRGKEDAGV